METPNVLVVFGKGDDRYDIIRSEILSAEDKVLVGLPVHEISRCYKRSREAALPAARRAGKTKKRGAGQPSQEESGVKSLVGRKVKSRDGQFVGHVIVNAEKCILVLGHHHYKFDIPLSKIQQIGRDVILSQGYEAVFAYSKPRTPSLSVNKVSV